MIPGLPVSFAVVNIHDNAEIDHQPSQLLLAPGRFTATITLAQPGRYPRPGNSFTFADHRNGDSHFALAPPAITPTPVIPTDDGTIIGTSVNNGIAYEFTGHPNTAGRLAYFTLTFDATTFQDAERQALDAMRPFLSTMSVHFDAPFHIYQLDLRHDATGTTQATFIGPHPIYPFAPPAAFAFPDDFAPYLSIYREATNNPSPVYQFLCYYKVAEALRARPTPPQPIKVTKSVPADAARQRALLTKLYPYNVAWDDDHLAQYFPAESHDKTIVDLLDNDLRDARNKIAHGILKDEPRGLNLDSHDDLSAILLWLPLLKIITRELLRRAFPGIYQSPTDALQAPSATPS